MLVCHCERVHCRDIRSCVDAGDEDVKSIEKRCGAGSKCGGCRPLIEDIIRVELLQRPKSDAA